MAIIRQGKKEDLPAALELIKELAVYEKEPDAVTNTLAMMEADGYGPKPIYDYIVAEENGKIVGLSMYYFRYSTWKGKKLHLEDLIVTQSKRGSGIGKLLFERTIEIAKETDCKAMMWQVLDWNEPAINFYKKYDPHFERGWIDCSLNF